MRMWNTDADADVYADAGVEQHWSSSGAKYVDFSKNYDSVTPARPIKVSGEQGGEREIDGDRQTVRQLSNNSPICLAACVRVCT